MVKFIGCLKRIPGMTSEEFHRYWKEQHGPLVKSVPEFFRYVRKYVQSHTIEDPVPGFSDFEMAFDGFCELWFDSLEDVGRAFAAPRYLEIIRADEQQFLDLPNCKAAVVEEVLMNAE
jgi:uncharacterized protein (TIGR02118 family)